MLSPGHATTDHMPNTERNPSRLPGLGWGLSPDLVWGLSHLGVWDPGTGEQVKGKLRDGREMNHLKGTGNDKLPHVPGTLTLAGKG